ncbi:MAG: M48 family metallopeptidase [Thermoguttaceae bacterium]|jgi:STE24 endopeptidase|nr:M48 family metallopeptidase [Thermoguttaceae bacterium]
MFTDTMPEPDAATDPSGEPPEAEAMTPEQLAEARRYGRAQLYCDLADKGLDLTYLAVAAIVLARPLDAWLSGAAFLARFDTLRLAALYMVVFALHVLVSFPLSLYAGHLLEHRYGMSTQSFFRWLSRYAKRLALGGGLALALFVALFWVIWLCGSYWWLVATGAFFLVSMVLGQLFPVLVLPLFYKVEKLDRPDLAECIGRLAEPAGLSIEGVYRLGLSAETVKANAMLAGLGRTRRVLLGDTLLDGFTVDETAVVFAHEIGHHAHRHLPKLLAAGLVASSAGFWLCDRALAWWAGALDAPLDYQNLTVAALPFIMLCLTVFGLLLEPLQNALSRRFERQADRYALHAIGQPAAYRSAFLKLARLNKDDPDPPWLEVALFHSHPPIASRLELADAFSNDPPAA